MVVASQGCIIERAAEMRRKKNIGRGLERKLSID